MRSIQLAAAAGALIAALTVSGCTGGATSAVVQARSAVHSPADVTASSTRSAELSQPPAIPVHPLTRSNEPTVGRTEPARTTTPPTPTLVAAPQISMVPADRGQDVSPIAPVVVQAANATLVQVSMRNPAGRLVKGQFSADRSRWMSAEPLGYGRTYTVQAKAQDPRGRSTAITRSFTTVTPTQTIYPSFYAPSDATTFGVGQPVVVTFDRPPADRAAAERALSVTAVPVTEGGWYWWDDRTVHWRPRQYWQPGTRVIVQANIYGINLGNGEYGQTDRTQTFTIGPSKIATINDRTHQMTVYIDGRKNRTIPVAMGRDQSITVNGLDISLITPSGTYVAQEKYLVKEMKSASYGLPADSPLGYDAQIPLAVRISDGGIFVHSAPWSVADQGVRNVSHGCININPVAAQWFYKIFGYGDVVTVAGTGTQLDSHDGFGDWNITWAKWLAGSALR